MQHCIPDCLNMTDGLMREFFELTFWESLEIPKAQNMLSLRLYVITLQVSFQ
jgi:hypothetical protein